MQLDTIVVAVEKNHWEFLLFILAFFRNCRDDDSDSRYDALNQSIGFNMLSAFIGTNL